MPSWQRQRDTSMIHMGRCFQVGWAQYLPIFIYIKDHQMSDRLIPSKSMMTTATAGIFQTPRPTAGDRFDFQRNSERRRKFQIFAQHESIFFPNEAIFRNFQHSFPGGWKVCLKRGALSFGKIDSFAVQSCTKLKSKAWVAFKSRTLRHFEIQFPN